MLSNQVDIFEKLRLIVGACENRDQTLTLDDSIRAVFLGFANFADSVEQNKLDLNQVMALAAMCMLVIRRSNTDLEIMDNTNAN